MVGLNFQLGLSYSKGQWLGCIAMGTLEVLSSCLNSWLRPGLLKTPIHRLVVTGLWWDKSLVSECISMYCLLHKESLTTKKPQNQKNPKAKNQKNKPLKIWLFHMIVQLSWGPVIKELVNRQWPADHALSITCLDSPQFPHSHRRIGLDHSHFHRCDPHEREALLSSENDGSAMILNLGCTLVSSGKLKRWIPCPRHFDLIGPGSGLSIWDF